MTSPQPQGNVKSQQPAFRKPKPLKGKTSNQKYYLNKLKNRHHDILFAVGPAGTGKTYMAVRHAINEFQANRYEKIVITRPNVSTGDDLGYLPGTLREKMQPWMLPITDVFEEAYAPHEISRMMAAGQIEIAPLAFMRGRTFKDSIVIADEMQNSTPEQMKMLLTRIGHGSNMLVTGDPKQWDRAQIGSINGLRDILARHDKSLRGQTQDLPAFVTDGLETHRDEHTQEASETDEHSRIGVVRFTLQDVVRHPAIQSVLELYDL